MPNKEKMVRFILRIQWGTLFLFFSFGCQSGGAGEPLIIVDSFTDTVDMAASNDVGAGSSEDQQDAGGLQSDLDMAGTQDSAIRLTLGDLDTTSLNPTQPAAIQGDLAYGTDGTLGMTWCGMGEDRLTVWYSSFDETGNGLGEPITLSHWISGQENEPVICSLKGGGFAIAWAADTQGAIPNLHVRYRLVSAEGIPLGTESQRIGDDALGNHWLPSIGCLESGGFVVAGVSSEDNGTFGIFHARISGTGEVLSITRVNENEQGSQLYPSVAVDPRTDRSLIVWEHHFDDARPSQLRGRWVSATGEAVDGEFPIGPADIGLEKPSVAVSPGTGDALIVGHVTTPRLFLYRLPDGQTEAMALDVDDSEGSYQGDLSAHPAGLGFALLRLNGLRDDVGVSLSVLSVEGISIENHVFDRENLPPYTPAVAVSSNGLAALWTVRLPERAYGLVLGRIAGQ